ncbi:capsule biosynthesis protein [Actibacterium ureilyticum]|uniref:capsule biosynthesis protein n=1 Tax=Actibacterium ureilyticum TaxID=1590614 RepID=UPI000BAAC0C4|nr:capsule biosynthesis protein [Actibacterium ureilyticum]
MTTKPKAKKFRIRRNPRPGEPGTGAEQPDAGADAAPAPPETPAMSAEEALAAIRAENLTGRQLRLARRVAQKHGLTPASDFDAVRQLRQRGIDPFKMKNVLEVVPENARAARDQVQLPQTTPGPAPAPAPALPPQEARINEVSRIQRDIIRRRRRRLALLVVRLIVFVLLPTIAAGYYYFNIATPMYATKSEFVIQQADSVGGGGLGSLFSGTGLAVQQDSTQVQGYLQSREALQRLDADLDFKSHFASEDIDAIQRLAADATDEAAYKLYKRNVKIGYDPTEGILKMEVIAPDPATSAAFSQALISYAEERVDSQTQRLREDQMSGARESYLEAEENMRQAQERVLFLQERLGVLDPASETSAVMSQITGFETQIAEKRLELQQLLDNPRPNRARVQGVQGDIARMETLVAELRASLTETTGESASLASVSGELRIAEADLQTRQALLQQSLQQLESARIEANRQVRYLTLGVAPVAPDEATYPRAFENTLLALLIFGGIYLMLSMTATILKEQV